MDEDFHGQQMSVKRINWEKLDNKHVENTIWEQVSFHPMLDLL
jgi:hypothetical protein